MSIYLLLAVVFWGFSYIAIKESLNYLTPVELIAARFATGAITLLIIIKFKRLSLSMNGQFKNLLIAGIIVFVHFWIMATGMLYTTATNTAWILTTAPIFIAVLSIIVLKEKLHLGQGLAIIAATVGVLILVSNGDFTTLDWISSIGDWIVLGSCVTWAIYTVFTRRITAKLDALVATFWTIAISGLVIVPGSLIFNGGSMYFSLPVSGAVAVLFLGIGCLAGSFWFWSEGL
jgi:drug/metabolite transporter (DMT)-like permease